jgi:YD repeat-containing protein
MLKTSCLIIAFLFTFTSAAFSQSKNILDVNPYSGTATAKIPIYTVASGDVSIPVFLIYNTVGVKIKDEENNAGMSWQLIAGGQITRSLRGLPDDCKKDQAGNARLGWLYNTDGTKISSFSIANDNTKTCSLETQDITYINTNFGDLSDTEPDLFNVSAPGLSCQFVFDSNHNIKTIPYKDVKITYTTDSNGLINTISVLDNKGITYLFSVTETVTRQTNSVYTVNFFKTVYNQYKNGINYNLKWSLTSMTDANGNQVTLNYTAPSQSSVTSTPVSLDLGAANGATTRAFQYSITESHTNTGLVSEILDAGYNTLSFTYANNMNGNNYNISNIQGFGRNINFRYTYFVGSGNIVIRNFLASVSEASCDYPMGYKFGYYGNQTTILPDTSTKQIDYWGYYSNSQVNTTLLPSVNINPSNSSYPRYQNTASGTVGSDYSISLTGAARAADPANVMAGTLNSITYAGGGTTSIVYESNDYLDAPSNTVVKGGGIRIKQITDYDGLSTANNILKNYSYTDPATNISTGRPLTLPLYSFAIPYTGSGTNAVLWNYSTARSETDLSTEDESIVYSKVKMSQAGLGSTLYEYLSPVNYWTISASPDWTSTINDIARTNCANADFTKNDIYSYPFAPNTNYDFERGRLSKVTQFNDGGQEVAETGYSYVRTSSPTIITALRFDNNLSSLAYAKYNIYTSCDELIASTTKKVFDSNTLAQSQASTTTYAYASTQHKLVTQISSTNSDGSINTQNISYIKDYTVPGTTDANLIAIKNLQILNINIPVEKIFNVQRSGVVKTVGAELIKFNSFNPSTATLYLPNQRLSFVAADGVTNFASLAVSSGTTVNDSRYTPTQNYNWYDAAGNLTSVNDNNRHFKTVITNHFLNQPTLMADHVNYNEMAYNDFENSTNGNMFSVTGAATTTSSRTGLYALGLQSGGSLSSTIIRNQQAKNYVFSCWLTSAGTGTITVAITSGGTTVNYPMTFINSSGAWTYREIRIPTGSLAANFSVSFSSNATINIDDVLFYPEIAQVTTYAYDNVTHFKTAETNTDGVSNYYTYDQYGRLLYKYDQDKQIVQSKSYVRKSDLSTVIVQPSFSVTGGLYQPDPFIFTNTTTSNGCFVVDDLIYSWNFGDGTTAAGANATHTFSAAGSYTVTLTASSIKYGQFTSTYNVSVATGPTPVKIVYANNSSGGSITNISFYKGSYLIYSFNTATLSAGSAKVVPDLYTIKVSTSGTSSTLKSFTYQLGSAFTCYPNTSTNPVFTFTGDMRNTTASSVAFEIDFGACGL